MRIVCMARTNKGERGMGIRSVALALAAVLMIAGLASAQKPNDKQPKRDGLIGRAEDAVRRNRDRYQEETQRILDVLTTELEKSNTPNTPQLIQTFRDHITALDAQALLPTPHSSFEYLIGPQGVSIKRFVGKETFVKIPDTFEGHPVVTIDSDSFKGLRGITGVVFPKTTTTIFNMTFAGCTDLRSLNLPPQLTHIGFRAFEGCTSLKEVRIPASVEQIGLGCFQGSTNITAIVVDPANRKYKSWEGVLYDKDMTTLIACPVGRSGVVTIPASVKAIEGYAFLECNNLSRIIIPTSVTTIDGNAFAGCNVPRETVPAPAK